MYKPTGKWYLEYAETTPSLLFKVDSYVFSGETALQKVEIIDTPYFGRCLILDDSMQSAELDEYIYHETLIHPALVGLQEPRNILVMGSGEGSTLREILKYPLVEKVTAIDVDPQVVQICKDYLPSWHKGAYDHPKIEMHYQDARKYVEERDEQYDAVFVDVTEPLDDGPSYLLFTDQFYKIVAKRLKPNGILGLQAGMFDPSLLKCHSSVYQTLRRTFNYVSSAYAFIPSFANSWSFIFASQEVNVGSIDEDEINNRLASSGIFNLQFYDGETHRALFAIPKNCRLIRDREEFIIKDDKPLFVSY